MDISYPFFVWWRALKPKPMYRLQQLNLQNLLHTLLRRRPRLRTASQRTPILTLRTTLRSATARTCHLQPPSAPPCICSELELASGLGSAACPCSSLSTGYADFPSR